jgi:hypothetical protein
LRTSAMRYDDCSFMSVDDQQVIYMLVFYMLVIYMLGIYMLGIDTFILMKHHECSSQKLL